MALFSVHYCQICQFKQNFDTSGLMKNGQEQSFFANAGCATVIPAYPLPSHKIASLILPANLSRRFSIKWPDKKAR